MTKKYGDLNTATGTAFIRKQVEALVTALPLPIVSHEKGIMKKGSVVNTTELSGKQEGAMVISKGDNDSKYRLCIALGHKPDSGWTTIELDTAVNPAD